MRYLNKFKRTGVVFVLFLSLILMASMDKKQVDSNHNDDGDASVIELPSNRMVVVKYDNKVEGFDVTAVWQPVKVRYGHVIGPALVEFRHEGHGTAFTIAAQHFSLKEGLISVESEDWGDIVKLNQNSVTLIYPADITLSDANLFGTTEVPFFFMDLDFDGKKELLITEADNGQRGVATFKVYEVTDGEADLGYYPEKTNFEPYASLDELSELDRDSKEIVIYESMGACNSAHNVYKLSESEYAFNRRYELVRRMEERIEDDRCYQYHYDVSGGGRKFIEKVCTMNCD